MYSAAKNCLFVLLLHPLFMYPVEYKKPMSIWRRKIILHLIWDSHISLSYVYLIAVQMHIVYSEASSVCPFVKQ